MKLIKIALRAAFLVCMILPIAAFGSLEALFAPKADLWDRWTEHDPDSTATIDHSAWSAILMKNLSADETGLTRFAYGNMPDEDKATLAEYVNRLAGVRINAYSRGEQFAFWVNLYNALTVKTVLDHYPVASIRDIDISPGLFADGPWGKKLIQVEGEDISLNDIEHRILRPIWRDPRIHYAVNCASVGCPNLMPTAFTADNIEPLLDRAAREYVNSPRGLTINGDTATLSSIYVWFSEDFGGKAGVIAHLKEFAGPNLAEALNDAEFFNDRYDWALNGAKTE